MGTNNNQAAQYLTELLKPLTSNEFSVKDWFSFAVEIRNDKNNYLCMVRLEFKNCDCISRLLTNVVPTG